MIDPVAALATESRELYALAAGLADSDWDQPTPFKQWTVWDVIAHLHVADQWAIASLRGPAAFAAAAKPVMAALGGGRSMRDYAREHFVMLPGAAILQAWRSGQETLIQLAHATDPEVRLSWFGPSMGLRMFITARYMETWAHAQDLYDLLGHARQYHDDIHAIATLGIKTFGFCHSIRGLAVPAVQPHVRLTAPSGAIWTWNEASEAECIEGLASEFCHVVTQGRNIADTALRVTGPIAQQWMAIAQCFAGPPETPPAPGTRTARPVS